MTLEAYNPLIPLDLKNSAIPCAIFRIKVRDPSTAPVEVSPLATQLNAVGFSGYDTIGGPNQRQNPGYGNNRNQVVAGKGRTGVALTGPAGSMHLSAHADVVSATASWQDMTSLLADFEADGALTGAAAAESPAPQTTVDAALATNFSLEPGAERTVSFILSWHFPGGDFGRADIPQWMFKNGGNQYESWWANAAEVDRYVADQFDYLDATTNLYHQTVYSSNIPRYALDRMTSNLSVLKSPTSFWTKAGYFGIWESTSDKQEWFGNCKHVLHYAQGHARLFPELGRMLRDIDLRTQSAEGLLPDRDGGLTDAMDGHFGTILGVYREHLLSENNEYLMTAWPRTRKAMDYAIQRLDRDRDGMLSGAYHNTLDCNSSGTSPWIGSLYIAALKASERMAILMGENDLAAGYQKLWSTASQTQNQQLWNYCEVMSGFEHAASATMLQYGMIDQGMEIVREISKRYNGRHRGPGEVTAAPNATVTGSGSPFGEDECGKFYARALSSWSVLLALQGFSYDGPRQRIGFRPVWQPADHASFFSAAKGWGLFTQSRKPSAQQSVIDLKFGTLDVKTLVLAAPDGTKVSDIRVTLDGKLLPLRSHQQNGTGLEMEFEQSASLKAGSSLKIDLTL